MDSRERERDGEGTKRGRRGKGRGERGRVLTVVLTVNMAMLHVTTFDHACDRAARDLAVTPHVMAGPQAKFPVAEYGKAQQLHASANTADAGPEEPKTVQTERADSTALLKE
eukprot:1761123-Rhodomonas_salina.2